jgi:hypothetical protein
MSIIAQGGSESMEAQNHQPNPSPQRETKELQRASGALVQLTKQLAGTPTQRGVTAETRAQKEQIANLIQALGDPTHELHPVAVRQLIAIGAPAVPALSEALQPNRSWLTSYRAAEALAQLADGRATDALIEALHHTNSNVRWGAVTALAAIGDARAFLELRHIAREDRSKTSWGESVAGAAQSALDQMRGQNVLLRSGELLKTALACVAMLVGLILAWSVVNTLREELARFGREPIPALPSVVRPNPVRTPVAQPTPLPAAAPANDQAQPTPLVTEGFNSRVLTTGNVRLQPSRDLGERIGTVYVGTDVIILASTADQQWYRVRLGQRTNGSQINSPDGTGWVVATVLSPPEGTVPVEQNTQSAPNP